MIRESELGNRIKKFRISQGFTLEKLAQKAGLTRGYLSKIERSKKAPPVSTLISIAKALKISMAEIFGEGEQNNVHISLVKKKERRVIARDGTIFGYAYQTLAHQFRNKHMDPYILTLPIKAKQNTIFQHEGEEMLFVLEGVMKFFYGDQVFIAEEGDCLYFDSSIPHYGICQGNKETKCLMVIYTPE